MESPLGRSRAYSRKSKIIKSRILLKGKVAEIIPLDVIAECIDKCKSTTHREQISHYIAETLSFLQIGNSEEDAFSMLVVQI